MKNGLKSIGTALLCTILSYFHGGVRYDYGDTHFAPIWIQLVFKFAVFFVIFMVLICVKEAVVKKHKNNK